MPEKESEIKKTPSTTQANVLTSFARINPTVAKNITQKVDMIKLLAPTPRITPTDRYQRIQGFIQKYETAANNIVGSFLRNNLLTDIAFVIATIVILIVATYLTATDNSDTIIATLGASGVTWASQATAMYGHVKLYNQEKRNINLSVASLKADLALCKRDDNDCLDRVETLIRKAWELLRGSS